MAWQQNAMMYFSDDGSTWHRITDHNRQPINIGVTRIGTDNRMVNGRLRRYAVAKKRTFSVTWENIPAVAIPGNGGMGTVDSGYGGQDLLDWHDAHDGAFSVKFRKGTDSAKTAGDGTIETVSVMITDFSHDVNKRGPHQDLWTVSLTFEEV